MSNPGIKLSKLIKLLQILSNANHAPNPKAKEAYVKSEIAKEDQMKAFLASLCGGDKPVDVEVPKTPPKPKPKPKPIVEDGEPVKKD